MRILVYVKMWLGHGGAEQSMRILAEGLRDRHGHSVEVICGDVAGRPGFEGPVKGLAEHVARHRPDIVLTQLAWSKNLSKARKDLRVPVVQFIRCGIPPEKGLHHIYNSKWNMARHKGHGLVLYPPIWFAWSKTSMDMSKRQYVTMMSTSHHKGGDLLKPLAALLPKVKFLGITGFGGTQVKNFGDLPNLTLQKKLGPTRVHEIYEKTRVMILPARHESFGRTVAEALYNRIPVISSSKPGVRESGNGFVDFIKGLDPKDWAPVVCARYKDYRSMSEKAIAWAKQFSAGTIIDQLEEQLKQIMNKTGGSK